MLPRLIVAAAVTVTLLLRPALVSDLEHSPRAWLVSLGIVVASAVVRRLVARRSSAVAPWAAGVVTLGLFALVAAPAFRERTLHEDFPAVVAPEADVVVDVPSPTLTPTSTPGPLVTPSPRPAPTRPPSASPRPTVLAPTTVAPVVPTATARPTPKPAPTATLLSAGQLDGLDGHHASGRVAIYRVGDDAVLRFEEVDITGGAQPSVHLVPPGQQRPEGGIGLGALKAEHGSFSYPLPSSADPTWSVLIWCEPYDVPIGAADLH